MPPTEGSSLAAWWGEGAVRAIPGQIDDGASDGVLSPWRWRLVDDHGRRWLLCDRPAEPDVGDRPGAAPDRALSAAS